MLANRFRPGLHLNSFRKFGQTVVFYSSTKSNGNVESGEIFKEKIRRIRVAQNNKTPGDLRERLARIKSDPCNTPPCRVPIDIKAYRSSDKANRNYQKTWCEFKPLPIRKPKVRKNYPVIERRDPKELRDKQITACEPEGCELDNSECRSNRSKINCSRARLPSCCVKRKTQFLSFSECNKYPLSPPIAACECDRKPSLCEYWNFWRTKR